MNAGLILRLFECFATSEQGGSQSLCHPSAPMPANTANQPTNAQATESAEFPHPIVFFDGVCGMCNRAVDFLVTRDRHHHLRFAPLQGETSQRLLHLPPGSDYSTMYLWDQGRLYQQSDAVWRALSIAGGTWGFAGRVLRCVPRPLRNWGYGFIARNRYRFFGKKESCRLPKPEERALFLP